MSKLKTEVKYIDGVKHTICIGVKAPRKEERTFPAKSQSVSNLGRKRVELNIKH